MRVYLVRHGESEGNISNIHQPESSPLSYEGLRQADKLANRFVGVRVDKIIASPLMRTKQTAEAIARATQLEIEFDGRVQEIKRPSVVIGRSSREPEIHRIWQTIDAHIDDPNYHYSDEENFFDLKRRISAFIDQLAKREEKDLIVVSHGYAIRTFVGVMIFGHEFSIKHFYQMTKHMRFSNTGITICDHDQDNWHVTVINDAAHLLD